MKGANRPFFSLFDVQMMTMKKMLSAALLLSLGFNQVQAQAKFLEKIEKKAGEIVIPYEKYQLPNGLTILVHEDHSDPIVHVDVTYHVGSAREEIGKSGFAHFFEHMMFQGSDHVGDEQHFKIITEAGGTLNGTTNLDRTNYFETVPSNQLEKMLWLESDRMGFLLDAVTQQKFEVQRGTVKNERGQNYDNRPYGLVGEYSSKNLYPYGHPYSWLTIGYVEDLNRVNVNDLKNFFLRWYGPNNATVSVGGDVKTSNVVKLVEKYFGSIPRGPEVTKTVLPAVSVTADRYVTLVDNYARIPMLVKTYPTVPNYHPDMAALNCLAQIIGQGKTSVLYQQLIKKQLANQASANSRLNELAGEFSIQIVPLPGKSLGTMDSLYYDALTSFEKRGVTDDDIAKFKGGIEAQYINSLQSVSGKVSQLAAFQTFTGNPNRIGEMLKQYQSVTKADVWRVYEQYIKGKHCVTVSVLTKSMDNGAVKEPNYTIDSSTYQKPNYGYEGLVYRKAADNFDRSKMPGTGKSPMVNVPDYWKNNWKNGIRLMGTENNELPIVTINITLPGGHLAETADTSKTGLASMTGRMLNEDSKNYSAEAMSVELQKLGSSITVNSTNDGMRFSVQCQKKNLAATMALLEERMLRPDFKADAFTRLQKQALEGFKQAKSQPSSIAATVFDKLLYSSDNIYGMNDNGTEASIKRLSVDDVRAFYQQSLTGRNARVVVVGDITQKEAEASLAFLQQLPDKAVPEMKAFHIDAISKPVVYVIDVPKAAQTEFRVGKVTNLRYDAMGEYYRCDLMNYVLGGTFNSRLNLNLREKNAWTYGARSAFSGDRYTGRFAFSSGIKAEATDSALTEVLKEINLYAANGIKPDELSFMQNALFQRDALLYETGAQKAGFLNRMLEYNLSGAYVNEQNKILKALTVAEINQLAKKWLSTDEMIILLVGDKQKILPGVSKMGMELVELDVDGNKK
jgi:zinc protease